MLGLEPEPLYDAHVRAFRARDPEYLTNFRVRSTVLNQEYERTRKAYRVDNPVLTREQIAVAESRKKVY